MQIAGYAKYLMCVETYPSKNNPLHFVHKRSLFKDKNLSAIASKTSNCSCAYNKIVASHSYTHSILDSASRVSKLFHIDRIIYTV